MTKAEAKLIEQHAQRAYQALTGQLKSCALPIGWLQKQPEEIRAPIELAMASVYSILEAATAELGAKR